VRWYFCRPGAQPLGFATPFYSRNWEDASEKFDEIGEQPGPRPWDRGMPPPCSEGVRLCRPRVYLSRGLPPGRLLSRQVTQAGVPLCCCVDVPAFDESGGSVGPGGILWESVGPVGFSGSAMWFRGSRGHEPYALCWSGSANWEVNVPSLYLKTIIPNPTPGVTFNGTFNTQTWTVRLQVTVISPGGGGGGSVGGSLTFAAAGGGSCGATKNQQWTGIVPPQTYLYQIGGFGAGGAAGSHPGNNGTAATNFQGPTTVSVNPGQGGQQGTPIPVGTFTQYSPGGSPPAGGNPGFPGIVGPGGSGDFMVGGAGACSTVGGAGDFRYFPGPGNPATVGTGSGGGGAVSDSTDFAGGNGADGSIVVEEWNF
jgi:hypothetical protein